MKILVTGGAGYIGSHAVYHLIDQGHDVVVVDNLSTGHKEACHPESHFYQGDIKDAAWLDAVFDKERVEGVLHFAAKSLVGESMTKPILYFDNNVYGTQVLLETMLKHGVDKIVFSSTAAVYGEPIQIPIDEDHPTRPISPYGQSKRMMEELMYWTSKAHALRYVSLRYFNVAGAHREALVGEVHSPETHLIPIVLQVANGQREQLDLYGDDYDTPDGTCIRDYIDIDDLIKAHVLALEKLDQGMPSQIINLGNGRGFSNQEIISVSRQVTGHPIPVNLAPRRLGDPAVLIASNEKAKTCLGWEPKQTNLEQTIAQAWAFYQKYPKGYGRSYD